MDKKIFCDIKDSIDTPAVREILAACVFDNSPAGMAHKIAKYKANPDMLFYGYQVGGELLGVCGFEEHECRIEIYHIAVAKSDRQKGIGSAIIFALQMKYYKAIEAETDDDAVGFYRKIGFETIATQKYNVRRWACVLLPNKPLRPETDHERQARTYPIILSEYNPAWPQWFTEEKTNLERLIGIENISRISHFGSTSVPNLTAKPTVDILLEIAETIDIEDLIASLPNEEYICLRKEGNSLSEHDRVMFLKGYLSDGFADKVFHIHVRYPGNYDELYFRDYLIAHPEAAVEYADLKRNLFKDFEHNRDGYTAAKGKFIREITQKAKEG